MHGDHEPGQDPAFLPPFVARPRQPSEPAGSSHPLPPWSSAGHDLPPEAEQGASAETPEGPWTAMPAADAPEPWAEAPEPSQGEQGPASAAGEPWPGFESEPAPAARQDDDPWSLPPEPEPGEEPWASPAAAPTGEGPAEDEPWLLDATQAEALILDEPTDEPLVLDNPAAEPWLEEDEELVADVEPWSAAEAEPVGRVPSDRPESDLPPIPASPLDELAETAGQALAGGTSSWIEAPLATWPGEAEAWNTVAAGSESDIVTPAPAKDADLPRVADVLEELARDLRDRGRAALEPGGQDPLGTALAAFVAGWRAARGDG